MFKRLSSQVAFLLLGMLLGVGAGLSMMAIVIAGFGVLVSFAPLKVRRAALFLSAVAFVITLSQHPHVSAAWIGATVIIWVAAFVVSNDQTYPAGASALPR